MPKDIRNIMKEFKEEQFSLSTEHEQKFLGRLHQEFPEKKKSYKWIYVAASVIILISVGMSFFFKETTVSPSENNLKEINLGTISPEMKKIENYYLTAINYEIASLQVTPENKALLDEYLEKVNKLDIDYKRLSKKLTAEALDTNTIDALIINLQLRLQLLIQLKDQIKELQTKEKNNENSTI